MWIITTIKNDYFDEDDFIMQIEFLLEISGKPSEHRDDPKKTQKIVKINMSMRFGNINWRTVVKLVSFSGSQTSISLNRLYDSKVKCSYYTRIVKIELFS